MRRSLGIALLAALLVTPATARQTQQQFEPVAKITLRPVDGGDARGRLIVLADAETDEAAFNVTGRELEPTKRDTAAGFWLVGGGRSRFLGFTTIDDDGRLQASGPSEEDAKRFPKWLAKADRFVITLETKPKPKRPGETLLRGDLESTETTPAR